MAFAGIPAAAMWALGGAAAGGVAAEASGEDWKKGALLGATGGLGLSSLLGAGAAGAAGGAGATAAGGAEAALAAEAAAGQMGVAGVSGLAPAATGVGTAVSGTGAATAAESAFLADMAKAGATNVAVGGAQQAAFPEPEVTMTNPHPFSLQGVDPNQVFALIQQLQSQRIA